MKKMINPHQNLLFIATILALCVISFVHVFLFPLYDNMNARPSAAKTYADFEQSLCVANIKRTRKIFAGGGGSGYHRLPCPRYAIVTIVQGGRLGNQMWEYASVWALARRTGLEPYMPRCIKTRLEQVFEALTLPSFEDVAHCAIDMTQFVHSFDQWAYNNQSIMLPKYVILSDMVLQWVHDILQEFTFRRKLRAKSQQVLRAAARSARHNNNNASAAVYVGIHVRRTDYIEYLRRKHGTAPAEPRFYYDAMDYFHRRYDNVVFVVVSDDPRWCQEVFTGRRNVYFTNRTLPNSSGLDMAILAACNHSIFDYGTFGIWGAIFAGGDTVYYNLSSTAAAHIGRLLNWHALS